MIQRYSHFLMTRITSERYVKLEKRFNKWIDKRKSINDNYSKLKVSLILFMSTLYCCIITWIKVESSALFILYPNLIHAKINDMREYSKKITSDQLINIQNRYIKELKELDIIGG